MIPVGAAPSVQARLRSARDGALTVVHRGRDAVYVDVDGACVGVLGRHAVQVPCGLRTRLDLMPEARTAHLRDGVLHLDGEPLVVGRLLDVTVPALPQGLGVGAVRETAPPFDVVDLVGRGDGLTPYGDDVVCGWLALHRAAGTATPWLDAEVLALASRTTQLSATLLACAVRGEAVPELAAWVRALGSPDEPRRATALAALGHSSGRGLLHGGRLALQALTSRAGAA